jgi:hydroxypyruvate isomerase
MSHSISRRSAVHKLAGSAAVAWIAANLAENLAIAEQAVGPALKGRIRHSACKWCYPDIALEDFCKAAKDIGLQGVDLLDVNDLPMVKKYGLTSSMVSGVPGGIGTGLNRLENHDKIVAFMEETIPVAADAGAPNVICFPGNRAGMSNEQGLENCAIGLKRIMPTAEKHKVTVCMELLNSRKDHRDYMCDHSAWGIELAKKAGSEQFKLLYDIYHMQIMEGDIIATIKKNHQYFGHYHTGGVPGRAEIDDSQEINYPAVMRAIVETGFKGFVAQEFVPKNPDKLASLKKCVRICDV